MALVCSSSPRAAELAPLYERVERLARNNFKDAGIFLEKYVARGRHIEVQIFGDGKGNVVALGERDCSAQRRNQKVIEETPAPGLTKEARAQLWDTARKLGQSVSYESAGTVEFLYDSDTNAFYFLEVNTRLQVEHGVTEEVTGIDLVEWMVRQAAGEELPLVQERIKPQGASIQVRLYAEDPGRDFRPSSGLLTHVAWSPDARIETWVESGAEVSPFYDPMIAKIITKADTREAALRKMQHVLAETEIGGLETNLDYLRQLAASEVLARGEVLTRTLATFPYNASTIEVLSPGTQTTIQDWPGRTGYWSIGVPPSGPDGSSIVSPRQPHPRQRRRRAALEITISGPTLRLQPRGRDLPGRRGDERETRWHSRCLLAAGRRRCRPDSDARQCHRRRCACLSRRPRRFRRSRLPRKCGHLHARQIRRSWRPRVDAGRRPSA